MSIDVQALNDVLPAADSPTAKDWHYLRKLPEFLGDHPGPVRMLDLGAGDGRSRQVAIDVLGEDRLRWTGVDIGDSVEHLERPASAPPVDVYDGTNLPYEDASFDVVWCRQVLEHVRYPDLVVAEVARVLQPGGLFLGSVSQLEPYHSRSIFNWTHYGVRKVFADHGLQVKELMPGVDGLLLMLGAIFGWRTGLANFFSQETPLNLILEALFGNTSRYKDDDEKNYVGQRLKVTGHIHFVSRKND